MVNLLRLRKRDISQKKDLELFEKELIKKGYSRIAGIDEAGRGPLAGPVVAAAVILGDWRHDGINDSKKVSPKKRSVLFDLITENAVSISVGIVDHIKIDSVNIYQATLKAMYEAVSSLHITPDFLLIDAMRLDTDYSQLSITGGDGLSISIAAASIIAKVTRDRIMLKYHEQYPQYHFDRHKGYGTALHREMIKEHGPCPIHRRSFSPIREIYENR